MILNLDIAFTPLGTQGVLNYELFTFSGGEPHIKILSEVDPEEGVTITHRIKTFGDMGKLFVAISALREMGVKHINLFLPYFPGARQDRVMVPGEALTVKVYADLINSQKLDQVKIFDPHSDVTPALLDNCQVMTNHHFIEKIVQSLPDDLILISPDGGALKKIYKLAAHLQKYHVVECSKVREVKTGKLSGFKVYSDDLEGRDCLIVDDICDGGGTFLGLGTELKNKNAAKLYLAISHGIFSKGLDNLSSQFEKIYTTDSFNTPEIHTSLELIKLSNLNQ